MEAWVSKILINNPLLGLDPPPTNADRWSFWTLRTPTACQSLFSRFNVRTPTREQEEEESWCSKWRQGNVFTKARPDSLWQGTEEKVTACAAAKFRRFKKVLLYLRWMWLMLGRPWESGWLIHCCFQTRGDQGFFFFFFFLFRTHFPVILRKMHTLSGELAISICSGKDAHYSPQHTDTHCSTPEDTALDIV